MEPERELTELVERELDALGYELVKMEAFFSGRRKTLRVFIDRAEEPVTIDDCVRVTKALGLVLDARESLPGPYNLEITSPGSARPLTKPAHFARFRGAPSRVEYLNDAGVKMTAIGVIAEANETGIVLSTDDGETRIPHERIMRANLRDAGGGGREPEERKRPRRGRRPGKRF